MSPDCSREQTRLLGVHGALYKPKPNINVPIKYPYSHLRKSTQMIGAGIKYTFTNYKISHKIIMSCFFFTKRYKSNKSFFYRVLMLIICTQLSKEKSGHDRIINYTYIYTRRNIFSTLN